LPAYPRLAGQRACYAAAQLRLWQQGGRARGPLAAIMGPIARRLSQADIEAVSAWMERLPPSNRGATQ
jgi:cytochrome c553